MYPCVCVVVQVVPLNQAREFSHNRKAIYVFKKLEWQSLSVDLLPHPDMFKDERLMSPGMEDSSLDNDGAKRLFFGGERFLDSISGAANVTSVSLSHFHHSFVLL
jgi:hypothetical protein